MTIKIGELFAGYGGLGMGVHAVTGGEVAWFSEFDDAPSKILAHHWPDVPNHGDITLIDWSQVEPVDILTGGFPCQDVSLAGARAGLKDGTRSGLWSEFARAIAALKPKLVVIENVRGLLSAEASGPVESDPWGMGNGTDGPVLRALGAVLGDLAELGYDAEWCGVRAADAGAPHGRYRIFIAAYPAGQPWRFGHGDDVSARSRTFGRVPDSGRSDPANPAGARRGEGENGGTGRSDACPRARGMESQRGSGERTHATQDTYLAAGNQRREPTPGQAEGGWSRADTGRRGGAPAADTDSGKRDRWECDAVGVQIERVATSGSSNEPAPNSGGERFGEHSGKPSAEETWATGRDVADGPRGPRVDIDWGPYRPAIERWAHATGRLAPPATDQDWVTWEKAREVLLRKRRQISSRVPVGMRGSLRKATTPPSHRLSARFVEWMMGLPGGHVTQAGLTRNEQLKALGNGVVPQQATLAVGYLLNERVPA